MRGRRPAGGDDGDFCFLKVKYSVMRECRRARARGEGNFSSPRRREVEDAVSPLSRARSRAIPRAWIYGGDECGFGGGRVRRCASNPDDADQIPASTDAVPEVPAASDSTPAGDEMDFLGMMNAPKTRLTSSAGSYGRVHDAVRALQAPRRTTSTTCLGRRTVITGKPTRIERRAKGSDLDSTHCSRLPTTPPQRPRTRMDGET